MLTLVGYTRRGRFMVRHRVSRTRSEAGRHAHAKGMKFEDEIKRVNDLIQAKRIGAVVHCHAATKQRNGQVLWQAKGPFDWAGVLDGGVSLFFESKEKDFRQKSMPRKFTLPESSEHQLAALRNFAAIGADRCLCFVLFNWRLIDDDGAIVEAEMRLHPIQTIPDRTVLRERGVIAENRNWYQALISQEYREACQVGFVTYEEDEEIPI